MDLSNSIIPKSDQLNAEDLISGPLTVTIKDVTQGSLEQPVNVNLIEYPGRAYRPSKTMRRLMVVAWGPEATTYAGHQLTLVRNPEIQFGGVKVGGIEIAAMSHIDNPITVALTATRGRRRDHTVKPLQMQQPKSGTPEPDLILIDEWLTVINEATTLTQLEAAWKGATAAGITREPAIIAAKDKRKGELA